MNDATAMSLSILLVLAFFAYVLRLCFKSTDDLSDRHSAQRLALLDKLIEMRRASHQNDEDDEEALERMRDEIRSEQLGMRSSADVMRMALCESKSVMLRPGQKYLFLPADGCRTCAAMMREARSAYLGDGE